MTDSADEVEEVAESLEIYFPVFIEFEAVHADDPEPDNTAEKTARQRLDAALLKFFNKRIRPFQHARLIVLDTSMDSHSALATAQKLPKKATGWAYDCFGSKDEPNLAFAEAEEWSLADRNYQADVRFLGFTTYNKEQIQYITRRLVEEKKTYNFIFENCAHFAMDTAWSALSERQGVYNHFMQMQMPGGLPDAYPLVSRR